jgi:hypothetical protein
MVGWAGGIEPAAGDAGSSVGRGVVVGELDVAEGGGEVVATGRQLAASRVNTASTGMILKIFIFLHPRTIHQSGAKTP